MDQVREFIKSPKSIMDLIGIVKGNIDNDSANYESTNLVDIVFNSSVDKNDDLEQNTTNFSTDQDSNRETDSISSERNQRLSHAMTTRSQIGVHRPNPQYALQISAMLVVPKNVKFAKEIPEWNQAVLDEIEALNRNNT